LTLFDFRLVKIALKIYIYIYRERERERERVRERAKSHLRVLEILMAKWLLSCFYNITQCDLTHV